MIRYIYCLVLVFALWGAGTSSVYAVVTFETLPGGGTPTDDVALALGSNTYNDGGVTVAFGWDTIADGMIDTAAFFEATGEETGVGARNGFFAIGNPRDTPAGGNLGNFFLRGGGVGELDAVPGTFIIDYGTSTGVRALSGEIWDIDRSNTIGDFESWDVEVFGSSGSIDLLSISAESPNANFDALPTIFSFSGLTEDATRVEIRYTGGRPAVDVGLSFNNFNATTAVPEPSTFLYLVLGMGIVAWRRKLTPNRKSRLSQV